METRMFCVYLLKIYIKAQNMRVSMYFLHLELTFTPHYIITDKGLLGTNCDVVDSIRQHAHATY